MDIGLKIKAKPKLIGRVKLGQMLKQPEHEYLKLIETIESDDLFRKLIDKKDEIVRYQRFNRTDISKRFISLNEGISKDNSIPDIASTIKIKNDVIKTIRKIGLEKFKKYFLYNNEYKLAEVAKILNLGIDTVNEIQRIVDDVTVLKEFYPEPSGLEYINNYVKIGKFENENGDIKIGFFIPNYAKGKYLIDYKKLYQKFNQDPDYKKNKKKIKKIIRLMEIINTRKIILCRILEKIIDYQEKYLKSNNEKYLKPLSQRQMAREINVNVSSVNRAIYQRSIELPSGEEIPLAAFFIGTRRYNLNHIEEIFEKEPELTDKEIRKILLEKYNLNLARRTVCEYRHLYNSR